MKQIIKKILGLDKVEAEISENIKQQMELKAKAEAEAEAAKEAARIAKLSPKELATERKESYIAVLDTKVNKDNVRNGFFELDWNEYFIVELRLAGYQGETDEEVVDKWFQDLCRNIGAEAGVDMERRGSGFINVNNIGQGKAEIS